MKQITRLIPHTHYELTSEEVLIIKDCLKYCRHRLNHKKTNGIHGALSKKRQEEFYILLKQLEQ